MGRNLLCTHAPGWHLSFLIYNSFSEVEAINGSVRREGTQGRWLDREKQKTCRGGDFFVLEVENSLLNATLWGLASFARDRKVGYADMGSLRSVWYHRTLLFN